MNKPTYKYADWYKGNVYLETGAIIKSKTDNPIRAQLNNFSTSDREKIELKQKEIFETKCAEKLTQFKHVFKKRFKMSDAKDLLLKREVEDNRKILFLNPVQELHFKNRSFTISEDDLSVMRDYINTQIVKGEKYYGFVHSPNFKFAYQKETNDLVYANATFHYYKWLIKFQGTNNKSTSIPKKDSSAIPNENSKTGRIKVKVIALIHIYKGPPITRKNCNEIAAKYNYSGEGLFQDFTKFRSVNGRIKINDESKIKCKNRLELIESAIKLLRGKAREDAKKDHQELSKAIEKHEW